MFGVWDWIVFAAMLSVSLGIGTYHACFGGKQKTTREFLMGDRKMNVLPVAMSILVSFQSAILILGVPGEIYSHGVQYYLYTVGYVIGGVVASILFVPLFHPLKLTSMYEYLQLRYKSKVVKIIGSVISIITTLIYTGIASFAPSTALRAVSGFPEWASILIIGVVVTLYTILGGLKAVVWVDAFQAAIMLAGLLAITVKSMASVGGLGAALEINRQWSRVTLWNFDLDPTLRQTFWSLTIASFIMSAGTHGCSQASIQRFCAVRTKWEAQQTIIISLVGYALFKTLACLSGVGVFAYYANVGCDPLASRKLFSANQIIPYFVMEVLDFPGVPGLFVACLFSGALSSLSSNLSSVCALTWEDLLQPYLKSKTEETKARYTRGLVLIYGILGLAMTFIVMMFGGTVLQASLTFIGAAAGPLTGIVVLGAFFPWANWIGAITGSVISYILMMWIGIGKYSVRGVHDVLPSPVDNCNIGNINTSVFNNMNITVVGPHQPVSGLDKLYQVSFHWFPLFGILVCVMGGLAISFITGPMKSEDIDDSLIIPVIKRMCSCFSHSTRKARDNSENDVALLHGEQIRKDNNAPGGS